MTDIVVSYNTYDPGNNDELFVAVGIEDDLVTIVLSLKTDGDITVFLTPTDASKLSCAIQEAIKVINSQAP